MDVVMVVWLCIALALSFTFNTICVVIGWHLCREDFKLAARGVETDVRTVASTPNQAYQPELNDDYFERSRLASDEGGFPEDPRRGNVDFPDDMLARLKQMNEQEGGADE